jgi:hypothetical protein
MILKKKMMHQRQRRNIGRQNKKTREDELGIGDNVVLDDDVDEDMLENDIDDDDDIINPFNIVSEPDDDTDVELDEDQEDTEEG